MENEFPDSNCVVHEDDVDWGGPDHNTTPDCDEE